MKCKNGIKVFDFNGILPEYGENRIQLSFQKMQLSLMVYYDDIDTNSEGKHEINFEFACYYKVMSIPGVDDTSQEFPEQEDFTAIIEYMDSDFKSEWENNFNNIFKLRHLRCFFLDSNHYLEIICKDFKILKNL